MHLQMEGKARISCRSEIISRKSNNNFKFHLVLSAYSASIARRMRNFEMKFFYNKIKKKKLSICFLFSFPRAYIMDFVEEKFFRFI